MDDDFIKALSVPKNYVLQIEKGKSVFPPSKKTEGASVRGGDKNEQVVSHCSQLTPYFIFKNYDWLQNDVLLF